MPPQKTGYLTMIMKGETKVIIMSGSLKGLQTSFYAVTNGSVVFKANHCDKVIVTQVLKKKKPSKNPSGKAKVV